MISTKKHIRQLASILLARGIDDIVISPGSRNGPLIHTFAGSGKFSCRSIVDERSAAYFAMGLAQARNKPVVLVCTSGTAALNYSPGVAEAYYLNVPLVVLTADRPSWWIDQAESQCIRQDHVFREFTKKEVSLPLGESEQELWFAGRLINECLNAALSGTAGPVHINIPVDEPLHSLAEEELTPAGIIEEITALTSLPEGELGRLAEIFNQSAKVMILAGQQMPDPRIEKLLAALAERSGLAVLCEHLSNLQHPQFCGRVDLMMAVVREHPSDEFRPDLLISFGGQFVSKPLKQFLRRHKPGFHWHLSADARHFDTYQALTHVIRQDAASFLEQLLNRAEEKEAAYRQRWKDVENRVISRENSFLEETPFCDLKVFDRIAGAIPRNTAIHLGNSSPVRYALIQNPVPGALYLGNRGTAGIDGVLSTAVGFASASEKINTVILGDLSFFYDSNALWNKYTGKNLRVIVIHNGGGNIFGMIRGPENSPAFSEHFFTANTVRAEGIARTFGLDYYQAENEKELETAFSNFYSPLQKKAALLEIFTNAETNSRVFRQLFKAVSGG